MKNLVTKLEKEFMEKDNLTFENWLSFISLCDRRVTLMKEILETKTLLEQKENELVVLHETSFPEFFTNVNISEIKISSNKIEIIGGNND